MDADEGIEHHLQALRWRAGPLVLDAQDEGAGLFVGLHIDLHHLAAAREPQGVADDVVDRPAHQLGVPLHRGARQVRVDIVDIGPHADARGVRLEPGVVHHAAHQALDLEIALQLRIAALHP